MQKIFFKWLFFGLCTFAVWWVSQKLYLTTTSLKNITRNFEKNIVSHEKKQLLAWHHIQNHQSFIKSLEWGLDHSVQAPARMFMKNKNIDGFVITDTNCKILLKLGTGYHCEKPSGKSSISVQNKQIKIQTTFSLPQNYNLSLINFSPIAHSDLFKLSFHNKSRKNLTRNIIFSYQNIDIAAEGLWVKSLNMIPLKPQNIFPLWILFCCITFFILFLKQSRSHAKKLKEEQLFTKWCSDPQSDWVAKNVFLHHCQRSIQKHLERKDAAAIKSARRSSQLEETIKDYEKDKIQQTNEIVNLMPYESLSNQLLRTCPTAKEKLSNIQENLLDLQSLLKSLNSTSQLCSKTLDQWNQGCHERTPRRFFRFLSEQSSLTHSNQLEEQIFQLTKQIQSIQQHTQSSLSFFPKSQRYFSWIQNIFSHWHASTAQSHVASSLQLTDMLKELFPQLQIEGKITALPRKPFQIQINTLDALIDHIEPSLQKVILKEKYESQHIDWNISFSSEYQLPHWGLERIQKWLSAHGASCHQVRSKDYTTVTVHWKITESLSVSHSQHFKLEQPTELS